MKYKERLINKIELKEAKVAVIGLGYVGLPLALHIAKAGFRVVGVEKDEERVKEVNMGHSYIEDVDEDELKGLTFSGMLKAYNSYNPISDVDILIICVPTPLDRDRNPSLRYITDALRSSLPYLKRGQLLVLECTTYPGTTEEVLVPMIDSKGFKIGNDFFLAYSPERIDPGNKKYPINKIPKVVGGMTKPCSEVAKAFFNKIIDAGVYVASSPKVAEMSKLLENMFRLVNVSLVNEMAMLCDRMGIDVWEVIKLASTKPYGFMPFYPGPGAGGHCIPIDPYYLLWKARMHNFNMDFIQLAGKINDEMPRYIADRIERIIESLGKELCKSRVLLVGITYKKDVKDTRESPALKIASNLISKGIEVFYHDPYVPKILLGSKEYRSVDLDADVLKDQDLVVILTNHSNIDYEKIAKGSKLVYDVRNALEGYQTDNVIKLGAWKDVKS